MGCGGQEEGRRGRERRRRRGRGERPCLKEEGGGGTGKGEQTTRVLTHASRPAVAYLQHHALQFLGVGEPGRHARLRELHDLRDQVAHAVARVGGSRHQGHVGARVRVVVEESGV